MEFQSKNIRYKDSIQRYKGLGEMDADQLAETTMDPRHAPCADHLTDLEAAEQVFDSSWANDVAPRKEFISSSARPWTARASTPSDAGDACTAKSPDGVKQNGKKSRGSSRSVHPWACSEATRGREVRRSLVRRPGLGAGANRSPAEAEAPPPARRADGADVYLEVQRSAAFQEVRAATAVRGAGGPRLPRLYVAYVVTATTRRD
ncbi:hypothetical protein GCM10023238_29440 [Streptomyces heliomycini]